MAPLPLIPRSAIIVGGPWHGRLYPIPREQRELEVHWPDPHPYPTSSFDYPPIMPTFHVSYRERVVVLHSAAKPVSFMVAAVLSDDRANAMVFDAIGAAYRKMGGG